MNVVHIQFCWSLGSKVMIIYTIQALKFIQDIVIHCFVGIIIQEIMFKSLAWRRLANKQLAEPVMALYIDTYRRCRALICYEIT